MASTTGLTGAGSRAGGVVNRNIAPEEARPSGRVEPGLETGAVMVKEGWRSDPQPVPCPRIAADDPRPRSRAASARRPLFRGLRHRRDDGSPPHPDGDADGQHAVL